MSTLSSSKWPLSFSIMSRTIAHVRARSVVAIHGINGDREKTWTRNGVNWLRDLLPSIIPNARIFSWGYNAATHSGSEISQQFIYDHGTTLVSDLTLRRRLSKVMTCPA